MGRLLTPQPRSGTWTPVLTFATPGNLSVGYSDQQGLWRMDADGHVDLDFRLITNAFTYSTASGVLKITGVPFAAKTLANFSWLGSLAWGGITKTNFTEALCRINNAQQELNVVMSGSGQAFFGAIVATDVPSAGTVTLIGHLRYPTR